MRFTGLTLMGMLVYAASVTLAADATISTALLGVWKEKTGNTTYSFLKDHEFQYQEYHDPPARPQEKKGVWEAGKDSCCLEGNRTTAGNLMIRVGTDVCCHNAYFLGKNLVLSALSAPRYTGPCSNRVLTREASNEDRK